MSAKASRSYYARVLGTFWRHPRTAALSLAACGAWVRCLSWCADHRTDGTIPRAVIPMVLGGRDDRRAVAELVSSGLLVEDGDALHVRDWSQHNITREQHEQKLESLRNRVAKSRGGNAEPTTNAGAGNDQAQAQVTPRVTRYTSSTDDAGTSIPSDQDQDQDQLRSSSASRARAREGPVRLQAPEGDPVESALRTGYGRRYAAAAGDAWMSHAKDLPSIQRAAAWCRAQPAPMEAAERFLDGAFGHPPWRAQRWPWKWLSEDPALTASRSSIAVGAMGTHSTLDEAMAAKLAAIPTIDVSDLDSILY